MARLVRHTATDPIKIEPQQKPIFVCACGLSQTFPICDGHHKKCRLEEPAKLYVYDERGDQILNVGDDPAAPV